MNCNESIKEIIWQMPIQMVFKLVAMNYQMLSGKTVLSHRDKYIKGAVLKKLEGMKNVK